MTPRLPPAAALAVALALAGAAAAEPALVSCPQPTRLVSRPSHDGRLDFCERADGVKDGPVGAAYGDGRKWIEGQYHDGKPAGHWRGWHANGRAAGEADFLAGGLARILAWYEDGTQALQADVPAGRLTLYDPQGRRRLETDVVDGKPTERSWDAQGNEVARPADLDDVAPVQEFVRMMFFLAAGH